MGVGRSLQLGKPFPLLLFLKARPRSAVESWSFESQFGGDLVVVYLLWAWGGKGGVETAGAVVVAGFISSKLLTIGSAAVTVARSTRCQGASGGKKDPLRANRDPPRR